MSFKLDRRSALKAGVALAASYALPAAAQGKSMRFAAVFSDKDIRADMIRMLAKEVEKDFKIEPFYNANRISTEDRGPSLPPPPDFGEQPVRRQLHSLMVR